MHGMETLSELLNFSKGNPHGVYRRISLTKGSDNVCAVSLNKLLNKVGVDLIRRDANMMLL